MTTTTPTLTPTTTAPDVALAPRRAGAGIVTTAGQTAKRTVLQFFRTPEVLMMATIQGVMFLLVFRYILGGAINTGGAVSYVDFLVPGFLATTALWNGMNAPAGIAEDAASGVHDRLRSLPIPRFAVVAGRAAADTALSTWGLAVTALVAFGVGFRTHADIGSVVAAFALMLAFAFVLSWLFITFGLIAGNAQAAQAMATLLVIPLTFVSSAYVPVHSMPGWMQPVAANQPITVMINAVRSLMLGGPHAAGLGHTTAYWVGLSLVWSVGILVVFASIAVARFSRTR